MDEAAPPTYTIQNWILFKCAAVSVIDVGVFKPWRRLCATPNLNFKFQNGCGILSNTFRTSFVKEKKECVKKEAQSVCGWRGMQRIVNNKCLEGIHRMQQQGIVAAEGRQRWLPAQRNMTCCSEIGQRQGERFGCDVVTA